MDDDRRQVLADFLRDQLLRTPKSLRLLCAFALLLCGFGLFVLAGVTLSGSAPIRETGVPLVLFLGLTGLFFLATVWSQFKIMGAPRHPIVTAVRSDASRVNRLVPTTVHGRGGARSALSFYVDGSGPYLVFMGVATRHPKVPATRPPGPNDARTARVWPAAELRHRHPHPHLEPPTTTLASRCLRDPALT